MNDLYIKRIDGLKFIAISLVLIEHFAFAIGKNISAGYYGVDLFFVISGFLITKVLINTKDLDNKKFVINFIGRRTLRIFPLYYLTILIMWLANYSTIREKLFWFVTYTYNYAWAAFSLKNNSVTHFWTLAVEEQFYLLWLVVAVLFRKKFNTFIGVTIGFIVLGYFQKYFSIFPAISKFNDVGLLTRMPSLCIGSLIAIANYKGYFDGRFLNSKRQELILLVFLILNLVLDTPFKPIFLVICSGCLIIKATNNGFSIAAIDKFLTKKYVVYFGRISYGIYILHLPVSYFFNKYFFKPYLLPTLYNLFNNHTMEVRQMIWLIRFPMLICITFFLAHISYKYFEKPILKLKDIYFSN